MSKRILSLALVALMLISSIGIIGVFAEGTAEEIGYEMRDFESSDFKSSADLTKEWFGVEDGQVIVDETKTNNGGISLFSVEDDKSAIEEFLAQWTNMREQSFGLSQDKTDYDFLYDNNELLSIEKNRGRLIKEMQSDKNINIVNAVVTTKIQDIEVKDDIISAQIYEWTFYDYDDLNDDKYILDASGFGTPHEMIIRNDFDGYKIIEDKYDEEDITGIVTFEKEDIYIPQENDENSIKLFGDISPMAVDTYTFDREAAVAYADKWVDKKADGTYNDSEYYNNKDYANFNGPNAGDCANYVSQCLNAGGMPQLVGTNYGTNGWFYKTSTNRSATWTSAPSLYKWMGDHRGTAVNSATNKQFNKGDILLTNSGGHVMICTGHNTAGTAYFNAHNKDAYHQVWTNGGNNPAVLLTPSSSSFTIQYNANGGSGAPATQTKKAGVDLKLSGTKPTRTGYTFLGWSEDKKATTATYSAGGTYKKDAAATLYAVWQVNTLTVNYYANGGSITSSTYKLTNSLVYNITGNTKYEQVWTYNNTKTNGLINASTFGLTRTGYAFIGWGKTAGANPAIDNKNVFDQKNADLKPATIYPNLDKESATIILYAIWQANAYTISYNANGGSGAPANQIKTYNQNLTLSSTKPSRTGYTFLGWSTDSAAATATYSAGGTYTANANATLYAVWQINTYPITYNANGGNGAPSAQTKTYNQNLTLSGAIPTRSGYTFYGWSTDSAAATAMYSPGGIYTANVSATLYAVWKITTYNDGDFIKTPDGSVYRLAGGAPIWVSPTSVAYFNIGYGATVKDITDAQYNALPRYPAPGTYIKNAQTQKIYKVILDGHLYHISSWDDVGGPKNFIEVDENGITHWALGLNCNPIGIVEQAEVPRNEKGEPIPGAIRIRGWTFDDDILKSSLALHIYIGGSATDPQAEFHYVGLANVSRLDVNTAYPGVGNNHGFDCIVQTNKIGVQNVYVYAINAADSAGNNIMLGPSTDISAPLPVNILPEIDDIDNIFNASVSYAAYIEDYGWQEDVSDGTISGTTGQVKSIEAINIELNSSDGDVSYKLYITDEGWTDTFSNGDTAGTPDSGNPPEAIQIMLSGAMSCYYDIYYKVHVHDLGWLSWMKNGETAGTEKSGKPIEAIQVRLVPKIFYSAHIAEIGWQGYVSSGWVAGTAGQVIQRTTGQALQMEAIKIKSDIIKGISYQAHIRDSGWLDIVSDDEIAGTTGQKLRMEAIKITLPEEYASDFDILYSSNLYNIGWTDWKKNGEISGTIGESRRIEAIKVMLAPKEILPTAVTGLSLDQSTLSLIAGGEPEVLDATVQPADATNQFVMWTSSDTSVATVANGVVTPISEGTATIMAITADKGKIADCTVIVTEPVILPDAAKATVATVTGRVGDMVDVTVTLENNPGLANFTLRLYFDKTKLEPVSVTQGAAITTGGIMDNLSAGDIAQLDYVSAFWYNTTNFTTNGVLYTVGFKIKDGVDAGAIPLTLTVVEASNQSGVDVDLAAENGAVNVITFVYGDVNGDGVVNGKDVVRLAQYVAEWPIVFTPSQLLAADVNGDGVVNGKDVVRLAQYVAEWPVELGK